MDHSRTVIKALDVLQHLAQAGRPLSVRQIATRAGLSPGSVYRILAALETRSAIRRLPDGRVLLGHFLAHVANAVEFHPELRTVAGGPMMDLRAKCGMETVGLYVRLNVAEMMCIETLPGRHQLSNVERLQEPVTIARGAVSTVFLASDVEKLGRDAVLTYLKNLPESVRPRDVHRHLEHVESTKKRGIGASSGSRIVGASSMACQVPSPFNNPVAVLCLSGPAERFASHATHDWGDHMKHAANRIGVALTSSISES